LNITPGSAPPAGSKISPSNVQPNIETPTVLSWTLRVEQALGSNTSLTVGYNGAHSYHQILSEDIERADSYIPARWHGEVSIGSGEC